MKCIVHISTRPINGWLVAFDLEDKRGNARRIEEPKMWIEDHVFEIMCDFEERFSEVVFYHDGELVDSSDYEPDYYDYLDEDGD